MKRMKEREKIINVSKVILETLHENELREELLIEAENYFNNDPDWDIGESRIFHLVNEGSNEVLIKYKVTVIYDPYFNINYEPIE